jgi:hypothetical protein
MLLDHAACLNSRKASIARFERTSLRSLQRLDRPQEDFGRLLWIFNLARGVKEVPSDLERVF